MNNTLLDWAYTQMEQNKHNISDTMFFIYQLKILDFTATRCGFLWTVIFVFTWKVVVRQTSQDEHTCVIRFITLGE